jgi:hypothetical protein
MMNAMRRYFPLLLLPLLVAAAAGGCATAGAKGESATTLLDVPLPPPRVLVPPPPPPEEPPADVGAAPDTSPGPVSGRKTPSAARPASPKKDPVEPSPAAGAAVVVPPPVAQAPTLEQPPGKPDETEGQVKATMAKAKADLDKVNYKGLNPDGKAQYDTAKRFIDEASQALGQKNLVYALKVADKAAGLAAGLLGR